MIVFGMTTTPTPVPQTTLSPSARWEDLRNEMLERIKEIDDATPFTEVTPDWWHEMMAAQQILHDHGFQGE